MSGAGLDPQQHGIGAALRVLQGCGELVAVPGHHAVVLMPVVTSVGG